MIDRFFKRGVSEPKFKAGEEVYLNATSENEKHLAGFYRITNYIGVVIPYDDNYGQVKHDKCTLYFKSSDVGAHVYELDIEINGVKYSGWLERGLQKIQPFKEFETFDEMMTWCLYGEGREPYVN